MYEIMIHNQSKGGLSTCLCVYPGKMALVGTGDRGASADAVTKKRREYDNIVIRTNKQRIMKNRNHKL